MEDANQKQTRENVLAFLHPDTILLKTNCMEICLPNFKPKMNFEELLSKRETEECDCSNHIRGAIFLMSILYLVFDCVHSCRRNHQIAELTVENNNLKTIVLKSLDKAFTNLMKNGNNSENEHED